uniref:C2H2-type domain-containing protein n=1 Tax=Hucho hucho TaxID=62062 RepID=A0A4W5JZ23_9TELE
DLEDGLVGGAPTEMSMLPTERHQQLISLMSSSFTKSSPSQIVKLVIPATVTNGKEPCNPPVKVASFHQWVSHIASNSISLPSLPPLPQNNDVDKEIRSDDTCLGSSVEIGGQETEANLFERAVIRKRRAPKPQRITVHLKRKIPEATIICQECGKSFVYPSQLENHLRIHTGEKPFKCTECGRAFRSLGGMTTHMKNHSEVRPFKCDECDKGFRKKADLKKHQLIHTGAKPHKCTICRKGYSQAFYCRIHIQSHASENNFPCTHCQKRFPTQYKLSVHERWHTMERPFICEQCGMRFFHPSGLKRHMDHGPKPKIPCPVCQKTFKQSSSLSSHKRLHTGERPYHCDMCGKTYKLNQHLKEIHIQSHASENNFPCTHCQKRFPTQYKLSVHERWHTMERPFICEQCGMRFFHPSGLKRHMGYHIGNRPFLCAQCGKTFVYEPIKSTLCATIHLFCYFIHSKGTQMYARMVLCDDFLIIHLKCSLSHRIKIHTHPNIYIYTEKC